MLGRLRGARLLAIALCFLAGYVDALGFLALGGYFVSFMSGNSTRLAVRLPFAPRESLLVAGLIVAFVIGVMIGSAVTGLASSRRAPTALGCVAALLALSAAAQQVQLVYLAALGMATAMGAANAVFQRSSDVSIGVTYVTGTLVKLGQHLVAALRGRERWAWVFYLLLWIGLIVGAATGAALYSAFHLDGLWFAAIAAGLLALVTSV
jgi:uncharacterized membrane protein YoaK (UPF0700 family)